MNNKPSLNSKLMVVLSKFQSISSFFYLLFYCVMLSLPASVYGQSYELLLDDGHVIDPKNRINKPMDVAIADGKIARVANDIAVEQATKVVDVSGLYVTPGLIDMHSHNYYGTDSEAAYSNGMNALPPDGFTFRAGVTTVVDPGGAGWRNFKHFKKQVIDHSKTRVLALLNIVGSGMKGGAVEQNMQDMNPKTTALVAQTNKEIVGVKLAHYNGHNFTPTELAVKAGQIAKVPVMIDFGSADPPLSLETLFMEKLRPGDIFTHTYANLDSRQSILDEDYNLRPFVLEAQRRGIVFGVGHGGGSFNFKTAIPAIKQGLKPDVISTDLHTNSMNSGMKNMLNVMSKFLNMGMSLQDVIDASTWQPAQVIQREELGNLDKGAVADVTVLKLREGVFGFVDADPGAKMTGNRKLQAELTLRAGEVVWDLNGITAPMWKD
ncbi:amidohydrolase/deacetylase family metallohydrolase [Halalkalibaculum sp. DA384]|uniref:amidohydrolase/deacetylase family metallohydrolase n=1 Tax=Halalkalibaculum sp. DA384 TaxID=3373606 RepID=UPI0037549AFF